MKWLTFIRKILRRRVAHRITLIILGMGALVALACAWLIQPILIDHERERIHVQLEEVMATVAHTMSLACTHHDLSLANEVARGIMTNKPLAAVRITCNDQVLASLPVTSGGGYWQSNTAISTPILATENNRQVGKVEVLPDERFIRDQAGVYAEYIAIVLQVEALVVALLVALVVLLLIVQPIKRLSDRLHRLNVAEAEQVALPRANEQNEIGRLAVDINGLITTLAGLLETERQMRRDLEISESKSRLIIDNAAMGICVIDSDDHLVSFNPAFAQMLRNNSLKPGQKLPLDLSIRERLARGDAHREDISLSRDRWAQLILHTLDDGLILGLLLDITEHKWREDEAMSLAERDPLTHLYNRLGIEQRLDELFRSYRARNEAHGETRPFAVMLMDLNKFKEVNDLHGHDAGDEVLCEVARRLDVLLRADDMVGRLGGDEFVVLLPSITDSPAAEHIRTLMAAGIQEPIKLSRGIEVSVGGSIGIAFPQPDDESASAVLQRADQAMYSVKQGESRLEVSR
ncbi:diguanylate cyclase domain-containing protein [Pokkaliibacter sp. CJK22405]|uniref:diguanylate cyclase domain-containing protein n=1 Tax=Pokkaliibacter sp. CJK22405 TaxID=3384615 RepID=UPI0039849CAB